MRVHQLFALNLQELSDFRGSIMTQRFFAGRTKPGETNWRKYNGNADWAITLTVDTSAAQFNSIPAYMISLGGVNGHWDLLGASCVYKASRTSFEVNLRWVDKRPLSTEEANHLRWHVNWIGVENIVQIDL